MPFDDGAVEQLSRLLDQFNFDPPSATATAIQLNKIPTSALFAPSAVARAIPGLTPPKLRAVMDTAPFGFADVEGNEQGIRELVDYHLRLSISEVVKGDEPYILDIHTTTDAGEVVPLKIRVYKTKQGYLLVNAKRTETTLLNIISQLLCTSSTREAWSGSELEDVVNAITCGNEVVGLTIEDVRLRGNYWCFGKCEFAYKCFWRFANGLMYPPPLVIVHSDYKTKFQAFLDEAVSRFDCSGEAKSYYILSRLLYSCAVYKKWEMCVGNVYVLPHCRDMHEIKLKITEGLKIYEIAPQLVEMDEEVHWCSAKAIGESCMDDAEGEPSSKRPRDASNLRPCVAKGVPKPNFELCEAWMCGQI